MDNMLTLGNAEVDGRDFFCWFVGPIDKWCAESNLPFDATKFALRNRKNLEIKWGIHPKGQRRPGGWAKAPGITTISVLVRGRFSIEFREHKKNSCSYKVLLKDEGDYVIWKEELEHMWVAEKDSRILTVRWEQASPPRQGV